MSDLEDSSLKTTWENFKVGMVGVILLAFVVVFLAVLSLPFWAYLFWQDGQIQTRFYLTGMVAYWVFGILCVIARWFRRLSIGDRNLAQIGMLRNVFTGQIIPKENIIYPENLSNSLFGLFLMSLLSWLAFVVDLVIFGKHSWQKWKRPQEVKRIQWIIQNNRLGILDVVRLDIKCAEAILARNFTEAEYEAYEQEMVDRGIDVKISDVIALNNKAPEGALLR